MNLSNRLTFSIVFSVLLVAAFTLVVVPAMAQEMVTYTAKGTVGKDKDTAGKWEVTFKFSEGGSFKKADFTTVILLLIPPVTTYNIQLGSGTNFTKVLFDAVKYDKNVLTVPIPKAATPTDTYAMLGYHSR